MFCDLPLSLNAYTLPLGTQLLVFLLKNKQINFMKHLADLSLICGYNLLRNAEGKKVQIFVF